MKLPRTAMAAMLLATVAPALANAQSSTSGSSDSASSSASSSTSSGASDSSETEAKDEKPARPGLDFSGLVFGDFHMSTDEASKAANGGKAPNEFDIGRAYLTFRMPAGDRFNVRVTTDIKQQDGSNGAYDGWIVRLKYAYLQYDIAKSGDPDHFAAVARVGMLHNVVIDHQQEFWPRYLNKVATETYDFFASADLGVATELTLPGKAGEFYATLVNGSGYDHPESDRFKDYAARVSLTPLGKTDGYFSTLTISPWIYSGKSASRFATDPSDPITAGLDRTRYGIFAGIRDRRLTLGGEWARKVDDVETGTTPLARGAVRNTGELYSAFAIARPLEWASGSDRSSVGLIFRWDQFTPDRDVTGKLRYLLGGVFWEPTSKTALALDYQRTEPVDGLGGDTSERWYVHWQVAF
ncbi:MAG TPA: hypothetical protein VIR34_03270 [Gemmatimonadaceae bacterium]